MAESYPRIVTLRAWHQTVKDVLGESWAARFVRLGAYISTLIFAYLWLEFIDKKSHVYSDAQLAAMLSLGVWLSLFVFGLLLHILWLVPASLWREQSTKIGTMEIQLTPKFSFSVAGPQVPEDVNYGHTSVSHGGTLQTVSTRQNVVLKVDIENLCDVPLSGCEAYLSRFSDIAAGEPKHWQSMRLPWLQIDGQLDGITIPAKGKRSVSLFRVLNNRTIFLTTEIPAPVVHAIKDKGEYRGLIILTAIGSAATYTNRH